MEGTSLSVIEQSKLSQLEEVIERNLQTFYEVGNALLQIRDERLYRQNYPNFDEYCRAKWGMSRIHAHRMIEAAEVQKDVLPIGNIPSESVARPLVTIKTPERRAEVYQEAVSTAPGGKVTARHVKDVVEKMEEKKKPEIHPVSDAYYFVSIAISQLERIRSDDPKRTEQLDRIALWIEKNR